MTAVPQAPEATAVPAQQPEITAEPLELATLIPTLEPVQATTPEPAATPEPTPYVAPTLNPDGTEPSGSLVVRVESEDGGEYTVQIYLKNDTMTFNPMMQLSCGKYGTIKRAKGDYTLQLIPVNGSAIVSIDGEPVETDENGVYTATVTILSGEKQEIHVILGNGNR